MKKYMMIACFSGLIIGLAIQEIKIINNLNDARILRKAAERSLKEAEELLKEMKQSNSKFKKEIL